MEIKNVKLQDSDDLIRAIICIIAQLVRITSQSSKQRIFFSSNQQ